MSTATQISLEAALKAAALEASQDLGCRFASISATCDSSGKLGTWFVHVAGKCAIGFTLEEAIQKAAGLLGDKTNDQLAEDLREQARTLMEEADNLARAPLQPS